MSEELHARLSPSGAHRYMECAGSVALEAEYPDEGSAYADEGTAAHLLATWCLTDKTLATDYLGEPIRVGQRQFVVTEDMARHVQAYVDFVRGEVAGGTLLVEQRVPIDHLTGEPGAKGTADAIGLFPSRRLIKVVDLKYGMGVRVEAERNPQALKYALGAMRHCDMLGEFDTVEVFIHMPRLDHVSKYVISATDLAVFADEVREAAKLANAALRDYRDPGVDTVDWENVYLKPGVKQCRFCRAKPGCKALAREVVELASGGVATAADFADLVVDKPSAETGNNWLGVAMSKVELVEDWCKAVRAEVERRLLGGDRVDGWKLVAGKRGPRKWVDEKAVESKLREQGLGDKDIYDISLISPTTAEKRFKTKPATWDSLQGLISQSEGRLSVAPAADGRPEVASRTATADDFAAFVNN